MSPWLPPGTMKDPRRRQWRLQRVPVDWSLLPAPPVWPAQHSRRHPRCCRCFDWRWRRRPLSCPTRVSQLLWGRLCPAHPPPQRRQLPQRLPHCRAPVPILPLVRTARRLLAALFLGLWSRSRLRRYRWKRPAEQPWSRLRPRRPLRLRPLLRSRPRRPWPRRQPVRGRARQRQSRWHCHRRSRLYRIDCWPRRSRRAPRLSSPNSARQRPDWTRHPLCRSLRSNRLSAARAAVLPLKKGRIGSARLLPGSARAGSARAGSARPMSWHRARPRMVARQRLGWMRMPAFATAR